MSNINKRTFDDVDVSEHDTVTAPSIKRRRFEEAYPNTAHPTDQGTSTGHSGNKSSSDEVHQSPEGWLFWRKVPQQWIPAVYHNDIRAELQDLASADGLLAYTYERKSGQGAYDMTAFHPQQQNWSGERKHWPNIRDDILNRFEETDYVYKFGDKSSGNWYHIDGRISKFFQFHLP